MGCGIYSLGRQTTPGLFSAGERAPAPRSGSLRSQVLHENPDACEETKREEASNEETKKQYDTNVFGVLNVVRAVVPYLRKQHSGHIINFSSLFGYGAIPVYALYGSTKFAIEGLSEGLAIELEPFGIKVTALAPGLFRTKFLEGGQYVTSAKTIPEYDNTPVGQMKKTPEQLQGNQEGDPAKLARGIVELSNEKNPPLHLPVGNDSLETYRTNTAKTTAEIEKWAGKFSSTKATN